MIPGCRSIILWVTVWILATAAELGAITPTTPSNVELICKVDSVLTTNSNDSIVVPVYMTNFNDSVAAFELWINTAYPEFIRFSADSSSGEVRARIDQTGTRCSDCAIISIILDVLHGLARITAFPLTPIPPGSGVLLKVILETNGTIPDSVCLNGELHLDPYRTSFSNTNYQTIGCDYDSLGRCTMNFTKFVLVDGRVHILPEYGDADGSCISTFPMPSISLPTSSRVVRLPGRFWAGMPTATALLMSRM
jgi:hypothetical protein